MHHARMHACSPLLSRRCVRRDPGQAHLIHDHSTGRSSTRERYAICFSCPVLHARLAPSFVFREGGRSRCASGSVCVRSEEDLIPGCLARKSHTRTHIHTNKYTRRPPCTSRRPLVHGHLLWMGHDRGLCFRVRWHTACVSLLIYLLTRLTRFAQVAPVRAGRAGVPAANGLGQSPIKMAQPYEAPAPQQTAGFKIASSSMLAVGSSVVYKQMVYIIMCVYKCMYMYVCIHMQKASSNSML